MVQKQIGNVQGLAAVGGKNFNGGDNNLVGFDNDNMDTIDAMRTRLTAAGYSADTLNKMTYNDCVYAIRLLENASTVK